MTEKPAFSESLRQRRIILPANGFFEWSRDEKRAKYRFSVDDAPTIYLCGLYKLVDGVPMLVADGDNAAHLGVKSYWGASHEIEIEKVYRCILEGKPFEIDGRSAFDALALLKSIYESSATGKWVTLPRI